MCIYTGYYSHIYFFTLSAEKNEMTPSSNKHIERPDIGFLYYFPKPIAK